MYKKIMLFSTLLCSLINGSIDHAPWIEIKPSYFFFTSSPMNDVYHKGGFEIQGSISVPLWTYLDFYSSIGCRKAWGHGLNTCQKTSITVMPIDVGLRPIFNFCKKFHYFFAFGPRYFYVHQDNKSSYVDCSIKRSGIGLFVNTGCNVILKHCISLGVFGEYSYEKKKVCPDKPNVFSNGAVQLGGLAFGLSIGYAF